MMVVALGLLMMTSAVAQPSPDFNGDGSVNFSDFFVFVGGFGTDDAAFDLNEDG